MSFEELTNSKILILHKRNYLHPEANKMNEFSIAIIQFTRMPVNIYFAFLWPEFKTKIKALNTETQNIYFNSTHQLIYKNNEKINHLSK